MYKTHCDTIEPNDNVIIGLGDSFTQGIGGYSLATWARIPNPSTYNLSGQHFIEEQGKNNWVRQLKNLHLKNYKVFNLGINGGGNRAAVRELYLNPLPEKLGNVIVILLATGIERFDFLKQSDDTAGINWHQKWQTIWPTISERGPISRLEKEYYEQIWSPRSDAIEFLFNVCEAQNFCISKGYKFLFASAFDHCIDKKSISDALGDKNHLINMINWNNFISVNNRTSLMDMVNQLEHPPRTMMEIFQFCGKLKMPTKYITPCGHWTIDGNKYVANYLYNEIVNRKLL